MENREHKIAFNRGGGGGGIVTSQFISGDQWNMYSLGVSECHLLMLAAFLRQQSLVFPIDPLSYYTR